MDSKDLELDNNSPVNAVDEREARILKQRAEVGILDNGQKKSFTPPEDPRSIAVDQLLGELRNISPRTFEVDYLKSLLDFCQKRYYFEDERRKTIEQKASQILSQSGALITLSTLGLASLFDKIKPLFGYQSIYLVAAVEIVLIVILIFGMIGLVAVLVSSMRNLQPKEYFFPEYAIALFDMKGSTVHYLLHTQIVYYLACIKANQIINDQKARRLGISFKIFAFSLVFVVGAGVAMLIILLISGKGGAT